MICQNQWVASNRCVLQTHPYSSHNFLGTQPQQRQDRDSAKYAQQQGANMHPSRYLVNTDKAAPSVSKYSLRPGFFLAPYLVENSMYDWVPWLWYPGTRDAHPMAIPEVVEGKCLFLWSSPYSLKNQCLRLLNPIGSMYGIYANIGGILMVDVTIYSIHGSYGTMLKLWLKGSNYHGKVVTCNRGWPEGRASLHRAEAPSAREVQSLKQGADTQWTVVNKCHDRNWQVCHDAAIAFVVEMEGLHVETGPVNVSVEPVGCLIVWNTKMPWFKTSFSGFVYPFYKMAVIKLYVIT